MSGTIEVKSGIAIPPIRTGPKPKDRVTDKYPFAQMEIGDSFFVACDDAAARFAVRNDVISHAAAFNRAFGAAFRIATRSVEGGLRIWRVAEDAVLQHASDPWRYRIAPKTVSSTQDDLVAALKRLRAVAVWDDDTDRAEFDAACAQADAALAKAGAA